MSEEQCLSPSDAAIQKFIEAMKKDQTLSSEIREALTRDLSAEDPTKLPTIVALGEKL